MADVRRGMGLALPVGLSLMPLAYLVWLCVRLHVDVPFWDQWELVGRLDLMDQGLLRVRDVWAQHNEHRPLFPILLMLGLARASGWNTALEIAAGVIMGAGIFVIYFHHLLVAWRSRGGAPLWLLPAISLLVFSPAQWENWLWGWQISAIMGVLATVAALVLICGERSTRARDSVAIACAVVATYSFAAGLVTWLVGALAIVLTPEDRRPSRLALWGGAAVVVFFSYFYDYHAPAGHASLASTLDGPEGVWTVPLFIAKYLGAPLASVQENRAAVLGVIALTVYALMVTRGWSLRRDPAFMFPAAVGLQTLIVATVSAGGRAAAGSGQALSSRYTTMSAPMWVALLMLLALVVRTGLATARPQAGRALLAAAIILAALLSSATGWTSVPVAEARSAYLRPARRALITGRNPAMMGRLYPEPALLKERRAILRMLHMSVFRD